MPEGEEGGKPDTSAATSTEASADTDNDAAKWKELARRHEDKAKKLYRENETLRGVAAELDAMKKAGVSSDERIAGLEAQLSAALAENSKLSATNARTSIAAKAGLAADDVSLIPLGSEEEMTEAATRLAKRLVKKVDFDGGARQTSAKPPQTLGEVISNLRNRR